MATEAPFPLMPPKSTESRLEHFDETVYTADSSTVLFKFLDALCSDAGAGSLKKEIFLQRLSGALEGIYYSDLDYVFGNMRVLSRAPSESYTYNPSSEMLTAEQWDEVRVKDAWYRSRIRDFFVGCNLGGTARGVRMIVQAAISADCTLYENWRYIDNFGLGDNLGRAGARQELVIQPKKSSLSPQETRLLRQMLDAIRPVDSIFTISLQGLTVATPTPISAAASDSTYFEVQKMVTANPDLAKLPPPELLAIDLDPSEKWLFSRSPEIAPYAAFNITSEYSYYYLASGGARSPIDQVSYGTLQPDGSVSPEQTFAAYTTIDNWTEWTDYPLADSPDNFPGGKFGVTPYARPAINPDGTAYQFAHPSQQEYVDQRKAEVLAAGGQADNLRYRLPVQKPSQSRVAFTPDLAIAWSAPVRQSTITSSWTSRRPRTSSRDVNSIRNFVRS